MIIIEKTEVFGWESAIRGLRNPMNSWNKSDSEFEEHVLDYATGTAVAFPCLKIGSADLKLMKSLAKAGTDHRKFMRMITVYLDITAPLYWWKEFDTYKVGTVANSCSTMHKIAEKEFTLKDFSHEHLTPGALASLDTTVERLNYARKQFNRGKTNVDDGMPTVNYWWDMIQLLPSSYNQRRTVMLNYEVLANMYHARKSHKLDEWVDFCKWIESLPYSELIIGDGEQL